MRPVLILHTLLITVITVITVKVNVELKVKVTACFKAKASVPHRVVAMTLVQNVKWTQRAHTNLF